MWRQYIETSPLRKERAEGPLEGWVFPSLFHIFSRQELLQPLMHAEGRQEGMRDQPHKKVTLMEAPRTPHGDRTRSKSYGESCMQTIARILGKFSSDYLLLSQTRRPPHEARRRWLWKSQVFVIHSGQQVKRTKSL